MLHACIMTTNTGVKQTLLFPKWWERKRAESFVFLWRPPRVSLVASAQGNAQTLAIPVEKKTFYLLMDCKVKIQHLTSTTIFLNLFKTPAFQGSVCVCIYTHTQSSLYSPLINVGAITGSGNMTYCLQRILIQVLGQRLIWIWLFCKYGTQSANVLAQYL